MDTGDKEVIALIPALAVPSAIELSRLENGMTVAVESLPMSANVSVRLSCKVSETDARKRGAVELLAFAMLQESDPLDVINLRRLAYVAGGELRAGFDENLLTLSVETPPDRVEAALTLFSRIVRRNEITNAAADLAYQSYWSRFLREAESPSFIPLRLEMDAAGFGTLTVLPMTGEQLTLAKREYVRPENCVLSIVGAIESPSVSRRAADLFGRFRPERAGRWLPPQLAKNTPTPPLPSLACAVPGPPPTHENFAAWLVAAYAAGRGKSCSLYSVLRAELAMIYRWDLKFAFANDRSYALIAISRTQLSDLLSDAFRTALSAEKALSDERVAAAKALARAEFESGWLQDLDEPSAFTQGQTTPSGRAFWLAWWELNGGGARNVLQFGERIANVDADKVREVWAASTRELKIRQYGNETRRAIARP